MQKSKIGPKLILASQSPRRRNLLEQARIDFSVIPSNFDEDSVRLSAPDVYVRQLAESKARDISEQYPASWVIGADTIVFIEDTILGKPGSRSEARTMLKNLSGKTHQVLTGYCVCCHIDSGEPFGKAGAYAIQGIGAFLVKRIDGSYTNVVGLPVCEVVELLINEKIIELT